MLYSKINNNNTNLNIAKTESEGNAELHAIATICNTHLSFTEQLQSMCDAIKDFIVQEKTERYSPIFIRLLLSDATNQAQEACQQLNLIAPNCAIAYVQQPPLNGTKLAAYIYMMQNVTTTHIDEKTIVAQRNQYSHFWSANICNPLANTLNETYSQLEYLENMLKQQHLNIADNCVRTWFYVQNIDVNYHDVVIARKNNFEQNGLTPQTHYISSTGIGGNHANKAVTSILNAYSIGGITPMQMWYLYASDNMNRTTDYGVTFERGTCLEYDNQLHVYISGTASIDNGGNIVAPGNITEQTYRMLENVDALLAEARCSESYLAHIVVYLRDIADYNVVNDIFSSRFANVPYIITLAPVCRPGWLIEMECMAVKDRQ